MLVWSHQTYLFSAFLLPVWRCRLRCEDEGRRRVTCLWVGDVRRWWRGIPGKMRRSVARELAYNIGWMWKMCLSLLFSLVLYIREATALNTFFYLEMYYKRRNIAVHRFDTFSHRLQREREISAFCNFFTSKHRFVTFIYPEGISR